MGDRFRRVACPAMGDDEDREDVPASADGALIWLAFRARRGDEAVARLVKVLAARLGADPGHVADAVAGLAEKLSPLPFWPSWEQAEQDARSRCTWLSPEDG